MNFINAMVYVFCAFVLATISGSVFSIFWLLMRRYLGESNELLLSRCLRIGAQFYLIPVLFSIELWRMGDNTLLWPWMKGGDPHVRAFESSETITWMVGIMTLVWLIGIAVVLSQYIKEKKKLREMLACTKAEDRQNVLDCYERIRERLGIHRNIVLLKSPNETIPCTVGTFRKKILVPEQTSDYSDKDLEVIFSHELMHCRRHDVFFKVEFYILNLIHALNPLAYLMRKQHSEYTEIACDLTTCDKMQDLFSHKEYSNVLLQMSMSENLLDESTSTKITEEKSALRKRIEAMLNCERRAKMKKGVAMLITALFVLGSSVTAIAAGNEAMTLYEGLYHATTQMTEDEIQTDSNTLTEYTMSYEEYSLRPGILMESGVTPRGKSIIINWNVPASTKYTTGTIHLNVGDKITVTLAIDPDDKNIWVGIGGGLGLDHVYVSGSDTINHTFTISKAGNYYVFVDNTSNVSVSVNGAAVY